MPLPRVTEYCPICGAKLFGRLDKRFCSSTCRSAYFRNKQAQRRPVTENVDAILHKNWKILSEWHEKTGKRKFFVERAALNRRGFHTRYYTTTSVNAERKKYHYIYDYAWMDFSEKEVMVVKLAKPK